jgi:transposase
VSQHLVEGRGCRGGHQARHDRGEERGTAPGDLPRARERLTDRQHARLAAAFAADPYDELKCAWALKETLRDVYDAADRAAGNAALDDWYQLVELYDVAEGHRLAATIRRWQDEILD